MGGKLELGSLRLVSCITTPGQTQPSDPVVIPLPFIPIPIGRHSRSWRPAVFLITSLILSSEPDTRYNAQNTGLLYSAPHGAFSSIPFFSPLCKCVAQLFFRACSKRGYYSN